MFYDHPDLLSVAGSRLYGTSDASSDHDYRGVVLEPMEYIIGFDNFEQWESPTEDKVVYGLRTFCRHLIKGNIQLLEILFSNDYVATAIGEQIIANRDLFLGKHFYRSFRGFALSEIRKAKAVELKLQFQDEVEEDLVTKICGKYQLKSYQRDSLLEILYENRDFNPVSEISTVQKIGKRRSESVENFGFSTKNAYHAIRLLAEGVEFLNTGKITFPRPEAADLIKIKLGQVTLDEVQNRFDSLSIELDKAYKVSALRNSLDKKKIQDFYIGLANVKI